METRKTVVVYDSFYEAMKLLSTDAAKVALFNGMMEYGLNGIDPKFDTTELKLSWTFYKPNMDANIRRYAKSVENGRKGGQAKAAKSISSNSSPREVEAVEKQPNYKQFVSDELKKIPLGMNDHK